MSIVVVGSVAFDSIETPSGRVDHALGGAATHFALAASYFTQVRVIGVVGEDFTAANEDVLKKRGVDTAGIEHVAGKSFHWTGSYTRTLNEADTLATELNVFETFTPKIPASYRDSEFYMSHYQKDALTEKGCVSSGILVSLLTDTSPGTL